MKYLSLIFLIIFILCIMGCEKDASTTSADMQTGLSSSNTSTIGTGGSMARFTIVGNYLYAVDRTSLNVIDISNPTNMKKLNSVDLGIDIETIFPFKDKLFIGSAVAVHIVDISNPASPVKLAEAIQPTVLRRCDPVVAKDSVAYATLRTSGPCGGTMSVLAVYNVKDVQHPVSVNTLPLSAPYGLGYAQNTLYVCDATMGLKVYDISQPYNPVPVKTVTGSDMRDVIIMGDVLIGWTATGLVLYDISNRQNPVLIKQIA